MANNTNDSKKYISLSRLSNFLDNIKVKYSQIGHKHTVSDLTDYTPISVDSELSSTSTNPVQNKVIDAEFEAVSDAMGALDLAVDGKADINHNHDDLYYTESEIDSKLSGKSDTTHNHDSSYDKKGTANTTVSVHNTATDAHNDIRVLINDLNTKVTNFLDVDDSTTDQLSEVLTLIEDNKGDLESLTTSKVNVSDIIDNLTTASAKKVLSANQGVAIKDLIDGKADATHSHTVSNISDLTATATELNYMDGVTSNVQTQLNNKASASDFANYYTKTQIDNLELITISDIDTICGSTISVASLDNEVSF
jgi:hypothetical protein